MEESEQVTSDDQIDQLNALRFKTQMGSKNLSREKSVKISENEIPCMGKEIPKEEPYNEYGDTAREVEIGSIGRHGGFLRIPFRRYRVANP